MSVLDVDIEPTVSFEDMWEVYPDGTTTMVINFAKTTRTFMEHNADDWGRFIRLISASWEYARAFLSEKDENFCRMMMLHLATFAASYTCRRYITISVAPICENDFRIKPGILVKATDGPTFLAGEPYRISIKLRNEFPGITFEEVLGDPLPDYRVRMTPMRHTYNFDLNPQLCHGVK